MRKAYKMEIFTESRECGSAYYGDFCYTEYEVVSEKVHCVFCGQEHVFYKEEMVLDFTCELCEAEFMEIESGIFEVLNWESGEFEDEKGVIIL